MLIDSHAHIYYDTYNNDLQEVLDRAADSGVKKIICVGVDLKSSNESIELAHKFNNVYATVGYHPHESKLAESNYLKTLEYDPNHFSACCNLALTYFELGETKKSIDIYRKANLIKPTDILVKDNLACALLRHSYFEEGFDFFESRLNKTNFEKIINSNHLNKLWNGEDLNRKSILIISDPFSYIVVV